jgi:hypothetical protein
MVYQDPGPGSDQNGGGVTAVAKEQAGQVGQTAADAGGKVAQTTKEQAQNVVGEAKQQARDLVGEARSQVRDQAGTQKGRAVQGLHALGDELEQMAQQGGQSGVATEVARQVSSRARDLAQYIDRHEPADLLEQARSYARRRPVVFLAGAALAGVVAGRMTRGLKDDSPARLTGGSPAQLTGTTDGYGTGYSDVATGTQTGAAYPATSYESSGYPPAGYEEPAGYEQPGYGSTAPGGFRAPDAGPVGTEYADQPGGTYQPVPGTGLGYEPPVEPEQPPARGWTP